MNLIGRRNTCLTTILKRNKISWTDGNPNNLRWQFKWKRAYYTYLRDGY